MAVKYSDVDKALKNKQSTEKEKSLKESNVRNVPAPSTAKKESPSMKEYQEYVKKVKKMGAKGTGVPTEAEYHQVQGRLRDKERLRRAMAKSIVNNGRKTVRTKAVEGGLREGGLTEEEIARFR